MAVNLADSAAAVIFHALACNNRFSNNKIYMLFAAGDLSVHKYHRDRPRELCCLLVESGFSFTHIVPYIQGKKQKDAILRVDVGGKVLTNHLKEVISYR